MRRCLWQLPHRGRFSSHPTGAYLSSRHERSCREQSQTCLNWQTDRRDQSHPNTVCVRYFHQHAPVQRHIEGEQDGSQGQAGPSLKFNKDSSDQAQRSPKTTEEWIAELDMLLPRRLSVADNDAVRCSPPRISSFNDVLELLEAARRAQGLLTFMVLKQRRYNAAVYVAEVLIKHVASTTNKPFDDLLPSNITWPEDAFRIEDKPAIELDRKLHVSRRPFAMSLTASGADTVSVDHKGTMASIWFLLARLIIAATTRPADESKQVMSVALRILALIHSLGLVPAAVYSDNTPKGTASVQRPPMLHLLNSRILSILSDAVWTAHQDEAAARAIRDGKLSWSILRPPPGTQIRSRLLELRPEIWLELVLWCCVESGSPATGAQIIKHLRQEHGRPWRALRWVEHQASYDQKSSFFSKHGEKDTSTRVLPGFISVEVVLAIVEGLADDLHVHHATDPTVLEAKWTQLSSILAFLEPKDLSPGQVDYLTVRLCQTNTCYEHKVHVLRAWLSGTEQLHEAHLPHDTPQTGTALSFDSLMDRNELRAGLLHQALQKHVESNLVMKSIDTFTEVQKVVDGNKLQTIGEFLSMPMLLENGFFTPRVNSGQDEFIRSHGQLPIYKLVPVLDMITQAKLFGLGDWMLFSNDVDGSVIPFGSWGRPSVAAAIIRYATTKGDAYLINRARQACEGYKTMLSVNTLRAFASHYIHVQAWSDVAYFLQELRRAEGGGYSPRLLADLAATVLRIETESYSSPQRDNDAALNSALLMFRALLRGMFNSGPAAFRVDQKKIFGQQIGYILRLLENVPGTELGAIANQYKSRFPVSNQPFLVAKTFNILYDAVIETKGALVGRDLWYLLCANPRQDASSPDDEYGNEEFLEASNTLVSDEEDFQEKRSATVSDLSDTPAATDNLNESHSTTKTEAPQTTISGGGKILTAAEPVLTFSGSDDIFGKKHNDAFEIPDAGARSRNGQISEIPIQSDDESVVLNPIVVPNMRTLQLLVHGALAEKATRNARQMPSSDLDGILVWAKQFYSAFDLKSSDINSEFYGRGPTKDRQLTSPLAGRRPLSGRYKFGMSKPDISGQFARSAMVANNRDMRRAEQVAELQAGQQADQIFGSAEQQHHSDKNAGPKYVERGTKGERVPARPLPPLIRKY